MKRLVHSLFSILVFFTVAPALAAAESNDRTRVERLASLAEVWAVAKYLHPSLAYRDIDWDAAAIAAIRSVRLAENDAEFIKALETMLAVLNDPSSRIIEKRSGSAPAEFNRPVTSRVREHVLLIDLRDYGEYAGSLRLQPNLSSIRKEIANSEAIILDLRAKPPEESPYVSFRLEYLFEKELVAQDSVAPAQRYLMHSGYVPEGAASSGGYYSAFQVEHPARFTAGKDSKPKRVIFLINEFTALPNLALALQSEGDARIIAEGAVVDGWVPYFQQVKLTEDHEAWIRSSELMIRDGRVHFDARVPSTPGDDAAMAEALRLLDQKKWDKVSYQNEKPLPVGRQRFEKTYPEMTYPDLEYRLLGAFRIWSVIHYFYPYLHLIGDWDSAFRDSIPRFENARDGAEYVRAVLQLLRHVEDGHTFAIGHPEIDRLYGDGRLPVVVRFIEGRPVVVEIWDDAVKAAGLDVGDVLTAVDGVRVDERIDFLKQFVPASTEPARLGRIGGLLLRGAERSTAKLTVEKAGGSVGHVSAVRRKNVQPPEKSPAETFKVLPGNFGYVDLRHLTVAQVDAMFDALRDTRGIIFDLRGYPRGTAWPIAPRINIRNAVYGASFRRAIVAGNLVQDMARGGWFFEQALPESSKWKYTRPTVMLIDDRTISQAEHTGLFFEAANGTRFIGSNSAGANGDITFFFLPGNIQVGFTGHDVRHADGRQLQRIGLVPDVYVEPTIAGIRGGKDEVLTRAIQFMEEQMRVK